MEKLWNILLAPYEHVGDMFEVYCLKNIFAWPSHVPMSKPAGTGRIYSQQEEKQIDNRIQQLEEAILKERRRKRTLLHIHDLYSKRLPQAELASLALDNMANDMLTKGIYATTTTTNNNNNTSSSSTNNQHYSTKDTAFTEFLEQGTRLKALCDRLAAASPDIAQQMTEVIEDNDENFLSNSSPDNYNSTTHSNRKISTTKKNNNNTDTTVLTSSSSNNNNNTGNNSTKLLLSKFDQSINTLGGTKK